MDRIEIRNRIKAITSPRSDRIALETLELDRETNIFKVQQEGFSANIPRHTQDQLKCMSFSATNFIGRFKKGADPGDLAGTQDIIKANGGRKTSVQSLEETNNLIVTCDDGGP